MKRAHKLLIVWVAVGVVLTVGIGLWFLSEYYSFEARFARSKDALEDYARVVMASDQALPPPAPPQRLGEFSPGKVERLPHGFMVYCDYGNPFDANGLAYSTEPLESDDHYHFQHIEGNWYDGIRWD